MVPRPTLRFRAVATLLIAVVRALRWRVHVEGAEHVPRDGGAVLVYNHHSYADFVMVAWHVYRELGRPLRFLAKREMFASRWTRWLVRAVEAVPVDRQHGAGRHRAMGEAIAALRAGHLVVVAPEQTISRSFELLPFKSGAARMAQAAGVPLVPVVGWGSHRLATKGQGVHLATGIPVVVRYGEPVQVPPQSDPRAVSEQVRARMETLLHQVQEAYPDQPGDDEDPWWVPARLGGTAPTHEQVTAEHEEREAGWEPGSGERRAAS